MVQLHAAGPADRLPLPGLEPSGPGAVHHLLRRTRGGPDRCQLADEAQVRLGRALLPRRLAVHAHGDDAARPHARRACQVRRPVLWWQADPGTLLRLPTEHHLWRFARRDADGAWRWSRVRAEDG